MNALPCISECLPGPPRALLEEMIAGDHLDVFFQPIVDLTSGRVAAYEVLGRARLPPRWADQGPQWLLTRAHQHGLGTALDRCWRRRALQKVSGSLPGGVRLHLNVDPRELLEQPLETARLVELTRAAGLVPGQIVLELTEVGMALQDPDLALAALRLREAGFGLAIDDLGAGFASLSAVLALRPDVIKLDRCLLTGADRDPLRAELLLALATFCRRADLTLVAEGLETADELRVLLRAGVGLAQGFHLARPAAWPDPAPLTVRSRRRLRALATGWGLC